MNIKFGNMTVAQFAAAVDAVFTADELAALESMRSDKVALANSDAFHIYDDPAISVHIAHAEGRAADLFKAANSRKTFNRPVQFYLDPVAS